MYAKPTICASFGRPAFALTVAKLLDEHAAMYAAGRVFLGAETARDQISEALDVARAYLTGEVPQ